MPVFAIPAIIGGVVAGGSSIASGLIGASAANHAADTQANAANYAANLQAQQAQQALDWQKQVYNNNQQLSAPWIQQGQGAINNLGYLMGVPGNYSMQNSFPEKPAGGIQMGGGLLQNASGYPGGIKPMSARYEGDGSPSYGPGTPYGNPTQNVPGGIRAGTPGPMLNLPTPQVNPQLGGFGSLMQPFQDKFQAPTDVTEQNDPGYQFRLNQGMKALQSSAAARGGLLTGGTGKALQQYGQDYASNEYANVYNRALQNYQIPQQNALNQYNMLSGLSGTGQVSANNLGAAGQQAASNAGNILLTSGQQIGNNINNAGAARASGYVGAANAYGGALTGGANSIMQSILLSQLLGGGGANIP